MKRWLVVDDAGVVLNIVTWDGKSEFEPEGTLRPDPGGIDIGDRIDKRNRLLESAPTEAPEMSAAEKLDAVVRVLVERGDLDPTFLATAQVSVDGEPVESRQ